MAGRVHGAWSEGGTVSAGRVDRTMSAGREVARVVGRVATSRATMTTVPVGLVGAAIVAGVLLEHRVARRMRNLPDTPAVADLGPIGGRPTTVVASDGVPLHVEELGPADAPQTLVFIHGFCVTADSWVLQARALADLGRMVFYDQRAHGRSGPSDVARCTIDQLADDLFRVLAERVPTGPVLLVGHSMGGMTVLALAAAHPELVDDRIIGVALLSTSAGGITRVTLGLPTALTGVARRVLPGLAVGIRHALPLLERARQRGSDLSWLLTRRVGFGSTDVPPSVVSFLETMVANTPIPVVAAFLPTLVNHDKLAAARLLRNTPTLVLVGDADLVTPIEHSRTIAAELPDAQFVVEAGAGHAVILERPEEVNSWIRELATRAATVAGGAAAEEAASPAAAVPSPRTPRTAWGTVSAAGSGVAPKRRLLRRRANTAQPDTGAEVDGHVPVHAGTDGGAPVEGGMGGSAPVGSGVTPKRRLLRRRADAAQPPDTGAPAGDAAAQRDDTSLRDTGTL